MEIFTVCFFGRRYIDRFDYIEGRIEELARGLIRSKEYVDFLAYNNRKKLK